MAGALPPAKSLKGKTMISAPSPVVSRHSPSAGFDFTLHIRRVCEDMTARLEPLRHIDMSRVAVCFSQTRRASSGGLFASLTPLRFAGGSRCAMRRRRWWMIQRVTAADGREMLYILRFYVPRFLDLPFREKLATTLHELWHIGPRFDGDLRRLAGRCYAHGASQKKYDAYIDTLLDRWLALHPPEALIDFLRPNFAELSARHGRVFGRRVPSPKLIPAERNADIVAREIVRSQPGK
jgi:predicted metallopeptidase